MELAQIIGLVAAFLTTAAFVPQVIRTLKTKSTRDISLGMFTMMFTGTALWLVYGLMIDELPVILANSVSVCLSFIIFFFKLRETIRDRME